MVIYQDDNKVTAADAGSWVDSARGIHMPSAILDAVRKDLIEHDHYDPSIVVAKGESGCFGSARLTICKSHSPSVSQYC